jgi:hypothetical protein
MPRDLPASQREGQRRVFAAISALIESRESRAR